MKEPVKDPRALLEVHDVARLLDVCEATVRSLTRRGRLRLAARTPRGGRLYDRADVELLCEARALRGTRGD